MEVFILSSSFTILGMCDLTMAGSEIGKCEFLVRIKSFEVFAVR